MMERAINELNLAIENGYAVSLVFCADGVSGFDIDILPDGMDVDDDKVILYEGENVYTFPVADVEVDDGLFTCRCENSSLQFEVLMDEKCF